VYAPAVSLERVHIESAEVSAKGVRVSVKARLYNPSDISQPLALTVTVFDSAGKAIHTFSKQMAPWTGEQEITAFAVASPASPNLYRRRMSAGDHQVEERFGLRNIEFPKHGVFSLNGERLFLRGTQRYEDHAGLAAAMTDDLIRKEMQMVKDMGANFIRLGITSSRALCWISATNSACRFGKRFRGVAAAWAAPSTRSGAAACCAT
jgi:beta-galactosidase